MSLMIVLLLAAAPVREPQLPPGVSCADIRAAVDAHGLAAAIWWARQNGYSWTQIFEAKKCLR